ncbi:hypothetical protein [Candidatus Spongiihabitans sp.]
MTAKTRDSISTHIREFCVPEDFRKAVNLEKQKQKSRTMAVD